MTTSDAFPVTRSLPLGFPDELELSKLASRLYQELGDAPVLANRADSARGNHPGREPPSPEVPLAGTSADAIELSVEPHLRDDVRTTHLSQVVDPAALDPAAAEPWIGTLAPIVIPHTVPPLGSILGQHPLASDVPYFLQGTFAAPPRIEPPLLGPQTSERVDLDPLKTLGPIGSAQPLDSAFVRRDFPILQERIHGNPLVWLDNGATTQKPSAVIDRLSRFYRTENSNIHRAAHELAARASNAYEEAHSIVARFLHASSSDEIVFVRGTTEGINLVTQSWGRRHIEAGDEIVLTHLEHHANIVPWQQLAHEKGARLRVAPVDDTGQIILEAYERLFSSRTKLAAFTQVSNALGTVLPVQEMIAIAHRHGARVLLDGAQGVAHMPVDMQALDVDWYVFSGHKIYGPTGIGALYGKRDLLESMPPWQGGGNMIRDVTFERTVYQDPPHRFEAGTGNIADAVGLGAALEYVERVGMHAIERAEQELLAYATPRMLAIPGLRLFGNAAHKAGVLSFLLAGYTPDEVGSALNLQGIAVRAGHHCAQPILRRFGVEATVRATLALYNTRHDVDALVSALHQLVGSRA